MLPENLAVVGGNAEQITVGAKGIKQIAVNGWGGSWSRIVRPPVFADLADPDGPQPLADVDIDSVEKLFVSLAAQEKHAPAGNGGRRVTAAQPGSLPYQFRPALRPFLEKPCLDGNSGAVETAQPGQSPPGACGWARTAVGAFRKSAMNVRANARLQAICSLLATGWGWRTLGIARPTVQVTINIAVHQAGWE